ncbi:MAG: trypsin-like peptidase domain-containing protein [Polyangiaceae bacterium]|nr:trypsin-like peptidase domain-containing protein [Polyangiaceae bacterium]
MIHVDPPQTPTRRGSRRIRAVVWAPRSIHGAVAALLTSGLGAPIAHARPPLAAGTEVVENTAEDAEAVDADSAARADGAEAAPDLADCAPGWERQAFTNAVRSVVRVETPNGWGAGFFFESSNLVVTALHVVEHFRWVDVVSRDGAVRRARVIHNGVQDLDLAILELETPFESASTPIPQSPLSPEVGLPVLMIGHPGTETGGWSVSWGRVGSETRENGAIEVDGTVNPGNSGGPLLDCQGRVLGVVSYLKDTGITMAIPITDLPRPGDRFFHAYRGAVATAARLPNIVYAREDGQNLWGIGLGGDLVLKNRFVTAVQGHYQWRNAEPAGPTIDRTHRRWQLEALEEVRVSAFGTFGFGLGGALSFDIHRTLTAGIDVTDPAAPVLAVSEDRDRSTRVRPMATASWELKPFQISYAFQLDVLRPESSSHRVILGVRTEKVLSYE